MINKESIILFLENQAIEFEKIYLVGGAVFNPKSFSDNDIVVVTNNCDLALKTPKDVTTKRTRLKISKLSRKASDELGYPIDFSFYDSELYNQTKIISNLDFILPYYNILSGEQGGRLDLNYDNITFKKLGVAPNRNDGITLQPDQSFYCINKKEMKVVSSINDITK